MSMSVDSEGTFSLTYQRHAMWIAKLLSPRVTIMRREGCKELALIEAEDMNSAGEGWGFSCQSWCWP